MKSLIYFSVIIVFASNIRAQEIGISPTKIWTDDYEIQNPVGFSVYYYQPIGKLGLKVEFISAKTKETIMDI